MRIFEDDDPLFAPMLNALFAAFRGTAVMSGCAPSATGANRNVTVAAGSVQVGGATVAVAGGTVTLDAGGEFDRYDLVTVDAAGGLAVTKGTVERKCPAQPADTCLIAIVFIPAGATVIATGDVYDARMDALRLSVLNINGDKNWNGKSITNVNQFQAASADITEITTSRYSLLPDNNLCYADYSTKEQTGTSEAIVKTSPPVPAGRSGTVTVYLNLKSNTSAGDAVARIHRNGVEVYQTSTNSTTFETRSANITVSPGDVLSLGLFATNASTTATNSLFEIRAIMIPGIVNSIAW